MNTYIAVVFSSDDKAHQALRKLWNLDEEGALTVHGAAVVRRAIGVLATAEGRAVRMAWPTLAGDRPPARNTGRPSGGMVVQSKRSPRPPGCPGPWPSSRKALAEG
jgi:hypothetical protein